MSSEKSQVANPQTTILLELLSKINALQTQINGLYFKIEKSLQILEEIQGPMEISDDEDLSE
jgi:hypothetical protein